MSTHAVFQGDVRIENNVFRETISTAIQWDEASTTSQLIDNDFIGNGADIYCTSSSGSPGLVGHGNKAGGGGAIRCLACTRLPLPLSEQSLGQTSRSLAVSSEDGRSSRCCRRRFERGARMRGSGSRRRIDG
ncbi:MAG: hypothetical protein U0235_14105 [Polyangiaceae bacterium]